MNTSGKLLLTVSETAQMLGIGRSKTYELIGEGSLAVVRIGRAIRVPMTEVEEYVARLQGGTWPGAAVGVGG